MTAADEALEAVERVLEEGGDADEVLRQAVAVLHERLELFVRISFVEQDGLVPGPAAGMPSATAAFPISFEGSRVAELEVGGDLSAAQRSLLERVAALLSPYALVGWDTGGEEWTP